MGCMKRPASARIADSIRSKRLSTAGGRRCSRSSRRTSTIRARRSTSSASVRPATRQTSSDVADDIVETVAHMMAAVKYFGDVDVICDIGGQDIKVLFMAHGEIRNFRLSNQ